MAYNNYMNYGQYPQSPYQSTQIQNQTPITTPQFQQQNQMQPQIPQLQQPNQMQQPMNEFVWVQGVNEATMYPLAPGHTIMMMDSNDLVLYMKTRESNGRYLPMDVYDLVLRGTPQSQLQTQQPMQQPQVDLSEYVRRSDLDSIIAAKVQEAVDKALAS